jgi:hypothetical protein
MMRAKIKCVKGPTRHIVGGREVRDLAAVVEIREEDGLFYLLRYAADGAFVTDTCHMTREEAVRQAESEYELESGWE